MLALKNLSKQTKVVSNCFKLIPRVAGERNHFAPSYYGIDVFIKHTEFVNRNERIDKKKIADTIKQFVDKPESKAFTEDIKNFLYLTKTDDDFNTLVKALEKYSTQDKSELFTFRFSSPLMKLAHVLNKTDQVLKLYLKEEQNFTHDTLASGFILMNRLFDEKRYDDVLKVYNRAMKLLKNTENSGQAVTDLMKVAAEANLEKSDDESERVAGELFKQMQTFKMKFITKVATILFLTAVEKKNYNLAYEIAQYVEQKNPQSNISINLSIMSLSLLNKPSEALKLFSIQKTFKNENTIYFESALEAFGKSVEQSNNAELKNEYHKVLDNIMMQKLRARNDLKEFSTRLVSQKPMRNDDNFQGDRRQNSSFRNRNNLNENEENVEERSAQKSNFKNRKY